jgi:hypothetical protein
MSGDILATLTYETARALVGCIYRVDLGTRTIELTVSEVRPAERPSSRRLKRDPFSIFFRGPRDIQLPQHMYDLIGDKLSLPHLFIVPIGVTDGGDGYEYQAIFT